MFRTVVDGFSPLKLPNFRMYISGQAVSLIGTWLQITAQSWVVWELSHSETALGVVAMLGALPTLLFGPWAGVLADRLNRRFLLIFTQVGMMLLAFSLALLVQLKIIQLWHVYTISGILGIFAALDFPTQQAFLGDLSGMAEVRKAVNMNSMFFQASRMVGPALAGWVIGRWGVTITFWINGASFLAVIGSLLFVRAHQVRRRVTNNSVLGDLWEGMHFLRGQPRMQDLLTLSIGMAVLAISIMNLMPAFASEVLGGNASTLGSLLAAAGAGALTSVVILMPLAQARQHIGMLMCLAMIWAGVWFLGLSMVHGLPLAMLCLFAVNFSLPLVLAMSMGLIQLLTPGEMRARVISLFTMVSFGLQPLGALLMGGVAERFGVASTVAVNGTLLMILGLGMLFLRQGLRQWQVHAAVTAATENMAPAVGMELPVPIMDAGENELPEER
ncbi:MAG TPA: MFS transporter [Anaerolineales bacterium]|jgi:MFS family permease